MTRYFGAIVLGAMVSTSCATAVRDTHLAFANNVTATPASAPASHLREAAEPLQLDVYPRYTSAQSDAWIRLRVEPDARSRSIELEWFSAEGGGGAHLINLEGERAAVRHQFPIKRLATGEYEVTAVLTRNDGTRVRRTATVTVVGPEGSSRPADAGPTPNSQVPTSNSQPSNSQPSNFQPSNFQPSNFPLGRLTPAPRLSIA